MWHRLYHFCKCIGINARLYNSRPRTNDIICKALVPRCAGGLLHAVQVAAVDRGILRLLSDGGMHQCQQAVHQRMLTND
jgi:hypothetical protein